MIKIARLEDDIKINRAKKEMKCKFTLASPQLAIRASAHNSARILGLKWHFNAKSLPNILFGIDARPQNGDYEEINEFDVIWASML